MDTTPKQLKLQTLNNLSWSEYIKLFNAKHNPMLTSVGIVKVKINEKRENGPGSLEPYSQNKRDALNFLTPKCK